jgi:hypothetical protein
MIKNPSEKDETYLRNIEKIGDSKENIYCMENVLSEEEHKMIIDYAKSNDSWYSEPWDAKSIRSDKLSKEIFDTLDKVFTIVYETIKNIYGVEVDPFKKSELHIVKFVTGFSLMPHVDTLSSESNHIASIYYLNEDYTGGEIVFPGHDLKIKPKANSIIIFPGNENYLHEVLKIVDRDRYSSAMWFQFTGSSFNKKREWYD